MASEWFYQMKGEQIGPISSAEMRATSLSKAQSRNSPRLGRAPRAHGFWRNVCKEFFPSINDSGKDAAKAEPPALPSTMALPISRGEASTGPRFEALRQQVFASAKRTWSQ